MEKSRTGSKKIMLMAILLLVLTAIIITIIINVNKKDKYRIIKVKDFNKDVTIQRADGNIYDAFSGLQLYSGDMVTVGNDSFLELLADEDKHIGADGDTGFIIRSKGTSKKGNITIELLYGKALFTIDEKLNEDSTFNVTTPNATLSVRGTIFSVEYNPQTNKTIVEVMEGSVWVESDGEERVIESGESYNIGGIVSFEGDMYAADSKFMLTRYYQNVPDYANVPPEKVEIDIYYPIEGNTNASAAFEDNPGASDPLASSALEIDSAYIEPIMDKANQYFEENKEAMIRNFSKGIYAERVDVTEWFGELLDNEITVNYGDDSFSFNCTRVDMDWIYSFSENVSEDDYVVYYPVNYIGEDGEQYSISGITFTFYGE